MRKFTKRKEARGGFMREVGMTSCQSYLLLFSCLFVNPAFQSSDCLAAAFAGADADALFEWQDEDFSVAHFALLAGTGAFDDGLDRGLNELLVHGDLQLHLPQQVHFELVAAVNLGLPLLAAESLAVHHGEAEHFHFG